MRFRPPILVPLALLGFAGAITMAVRGGQDQAPMPPVALPAQAPFANFVAGAALIEPANENISIGTPLAGLVMEVPVKAGDRVKAGDLLFRLDDRQSQAALAAAKAQLASAQASLAVAQAELARLAAGTRPEELAIRQADVRVAEAQLADLQDQLDTFDKINDARAISRLELDRRRFAVATAKANLEKIKAEYALSDAGTWGRDLAIAQAKCAVAEAQAVSAGAQVNAAQVELARLRVAAPADGQVLRVNIHAGEFAPVQPFGGTSSLMLLGDTRILHVRVDIDENDAWRVKAGAKAKAYARGNRDLGVDLQFVRIEPLVVPKRNLTGDSTERVDTRVLQAIFAFEPKELPLYVGQQMDVYIEDASVR